MKKLITIALTVASLSTFAQAPSAAKIKLDHKLEFEFNSILETIENNYGPLRLKKDSVDLDWDEAKLIYQKALKEVKNTNEYFLLVSQVFSNLKDAHVSLELPSTMTLTYPFQFVYAEGKTFVSFLPKEMDQCKVEVGDELLSINGNTPDTIRSFLSKFIGLGNEVSDKSYLTLKMNRLTEASGTPVSFLDSPIEVFEFKKNDGKKIQCFMDIRPKGISFIGRSFHQAPEVIPPVVKEQDLLKDWNKEVDDAAKANNLSENETKNLKHLNKIIHLNHKLFNTKASVGLDLLEASKTSEGTQVELGAKKPFFKLPKNFKRIKPYGLLNGLFNSSNFYAGTFKRNGKRIGFLRIPSYMPTNPAGMLMSIRYYIQKLEKKSDMLIIDQTNNPGGMVAFSDMIISHLVAKPSEQTHMKFLVRPTQDFMRTYVEMTQSILSDEEHGEYYLKKYLPQIMSEFSKVQKVYESGEELSEPVSIKIMSDYLEDILSSIFRNPETKKTTLLGKLALGINPLKGNFTKKTVYSKPIFMWINELAFSGGDSTPAILQDYGRVKLVGVRTVGAGGTVSPYEQGVLHQFKFKLTTSLMYRPMNKKTKYVENYGVTPDINFSLTAKDVKENYENTFERFLTTIGL